MSDEISPYEVSDSEVSSVSSDSLPATPSKLSKIFGVTHLVYAVFGILVSLSALTLPLLMKASADLMGLSGEAKEMFINSLQGMMSYAYVDMAIKLVFGLLLAVAGIGLLKEKMWAAKLSFYWALLRIVVSIVMVAVMSGPRRAFQSQMQESMIGVSGGTESFQLQQGLEGVGNVVSVALLIVYPVLCLIFLTKQSVKATLK